MLNINPDIDSRKRIAPKRFRFFLAVLLIVLLSAIWGCEMWGVEIVRRCLNSTSQCVGQGSEITDWLTGVASILSLCSLILVGYLFHWYSRYESSATELANQLRAVGAHLIVSESDPDGTITHVNQAFIDTSGYSREEIIGKNHRMFNSGFYPKDFYRNLWTTVSAGHIWRGTFKNVTKGRNTYWLQATIVPFKDVWGRVSRYVALYTDITEAIARAESAERERRLRENLARINEELSSDVNTDKLTGLPNRRAFAAFADRILKVEREGVRPVSVLMIDLDFFKVINDSYGRDAGDDVLIELSRRWEKFVRSSDMLARIGGEEFCVLLNDATSDQAMIVAEKLRLAAAAHPGRRCRRPSGWRCRPRRPG